MSVDVWRAAGRCVGLCLFSFGRMIGPFAPGGLAAVVVGAGCEHVRRVVAMSRWTECLIGVGGNQGDVQATFAQFWQRLSCDADFGDCRAAGLFESRPMQGTDEVGEAPTYLNTAVTVRTRLDPWMLLDRLRHWESALGRRPSGRWTSRPIDLDVLLYGSHRMDDARLVIPHPGLTYRRFVLDPACEVAADWCLPTTAVSLRQWRCRLSERPLYVAVQDDPEESGERVALQAAVRALSRRFPEPIVQAISPAGDPLCHADRARAPAFDCHGRPQHGANAFENGQTATRWPVLVVRLHRHGDRPLPESTMPRSAGEPAVVFPGEDDPEGMAFAAAVLTAATDVPSRVAPAEAWTLA
ncbi:MAG: 2-amino-4-hydroxy-6-hydroxymethyldihydropteridine diphosphokinase [Planctomycetota bacterium]|nr:MAG: 2-amino-4-hydroxy-6-hydroxymethyldihydropteridine diphosphokinase [Planctomycetota bacterium]